MNTTKKSQFQQRLEENQKKIQEILQNDFVEIDLLDLEVHEDLCHEETEIEAKFKIDGETETFQGEGKGTVDALWSATDFLREKHQLLQDIEFDGYEAEAVGFDEDLISTDAEVDVEIYMNKQGEGIYIRKRSHSVLRASVLCFVELLEYMVNSQKAFEELKHLIDNAQERNRQDLKSKYTNLLSELTWVVPH